MQGHLVRFRSADVDFVLYSSSSRFASDISCRKQGLNGAGRLIELVSLPDRGGFECIQVLACLPWLMVCRMARFDRINSSRPQEERFNLFGQDLSQCALVSR